MRKLSVLLLGVTFLGGMALSQRETPVSTLATPAVAAATDKDRKADAPYVKLPVKKEAKPNRYFHLKADTNCPSVRWIIPEGLEQLDPSIQLQDKNLVVLIGDTGTYTVQAYGALGDQASDVATCKVTIGSPPPPVPPVPPGPNPPVPPGPTPGPAPIPGQGLRVLIVYDHLAEGSLPLPQQAILFGQAVRDFLNSKCVVGADNSTHEWRIWDKATQPAGESQLWQDAFKRTSGKSLPWVIISNGTTGFEGALPASVADFEALVNKYATAAPMRKAG